MKAHKAREKSIEPQYEKTMENIKQAVEWGWSDCHTSNINGELYPEVAEMLVKDGFDVKIVLRDDPHMTYNAVSWRDAKKDREGSLVYVDERKKRFSEDKPKEDSDLTSFFIRSLFHGDDETEDEEKSGESAEEQETATGEAEAPETSEGIAEEPDETSSENLDDPSDVTDEAEPSASDLATEVQEGRNEAEEPETAEGEEPAADAENAAEATANGCDVLAVTDGKTYNRMWDAVASYMDDDIREELHVELCPCSNEMFLARYLERDPGFIKILEGITSDDEFED